MAFSENFKLPLFEDYELFFFSKFNSWKIFFFQIRSEMRIFKIIFDFVFARILFCFFFALKIHNVF
jgi:hypothetical protein